MRQDVDRLATRPATPPSPSPSRKEDASAHAGDVAARGGRGAEASMAAIRRNSLKSSASAANRPSASAASSEPYCASRSAAFFGPIPRAPAACRTGRRAARSGRAPARGRPRSARAPRPGPIRESSLTPLVGCRIVTRVAGELERVAVGGGHEHVARPPRARQRRGSRRPRSPEPSPTRKPNAATTSGRISSCSRIDSSNTLPDW